MYKSKMIPDDILEPLCPNTKAQVELITLTMVPKWNVAIVVETGSPSSALSEVHPSHTDVINAISGVEVPLLPVTIIFSHVMFDTITQIYQLHHSIMLQFLFIKASSGQKPTLTTLKY